MKENHRVIPAGTTHGLPRKLAKGAALLRSLALQAPSDATTSSSSGRLFVAQPLARGLALMRTEPPLRTFLRTFVSTNGRRRPSYAPFFYFGVLFIAREGKCSAKRREKFDCWACQHQFLVNNNHSKARCTQELLLLRLKSLLLLCVLAGWFLQERKEREANEQQQR